MSRAKLSYRPEIDGLRAIAVLSVLLYHARVKKFGIEWFEGGFVGVDIFFVLSGYLITRIILSELYDTGAFSFSRFYERRARRILPMLFLVIVASIPLAWQILLPYEFVEYAQSVLASILFGSNFFFYFSTTEYGADSSLLKPFLHTWSLGVEEQFYLIFPVIAILAFRFCRKHLLSVLVLTCLVSLVFSEVMETRNPDLNFYLPFSRFWELGAGSILAYRELNAVVSASAVMRRVLPIVGLILIAYAILFFDGDTPHPGIYTLIPVAGIALIIAFASRDEVVGKLLSIRPLVGMGLISYSAYLWHYPIFAFFRIAGDTALNSDKFGWILITLALSVVSYFAVEKTLRSPKVVGGKLFASLMLFSAAGLVAASLVASYGNGLPDRLPAILAKTDHGEPPWFSLTRLEDGKPCHQSGSSCFFPSAHPDTDPIIAILGDSDAASMAMTLVPRFNSRGLSVVVNVEGVCPFYIGADLSPQTPGKSAFYRAECSQEFQRQRLSELREFAPSLILQIGRLHQVALGSNLENPTQDVAGMENLSGKHLVVAGQRYLEEIAPTLYVKSLPTVAFRYGAPVNYVRRLIGSERDPSLIKTRLLSNPFEFEPIDSEVAAWAEFDRLLGAGNLFDTWRYACGANSTPRICRGFDLGGVYYFDSAHPSDHFINLFYDDLEVAILARINE